MIRKQASAYFSTAKKNLKLLFISGDMKEMAKDSLMPFSLKFLGSILAFIFNVVVAKLIGAEGSGIYYTAFSVVMISSVISRVGLDNALLRFISIHYSNAEWSKVRAYHGVGVRTVVLCAGIVSIVIILLSKPIAIGLLNKPELTEPLRWMTLTILPFSLINIQAECLKAVRHLKAAMLIQGAGIPAGALSVLIALGGAGEATEIARAYSIAAIIILLLAIYTWKLAIPKDSVAEKNLSYRELWKSCKPLLVTAIMNRALNPWAPILLLGILATNEDVGIYGAATRISLLVSLILVAMNSFLAPKFSVMYANGDLAALGKMARNASVLSTLLAMPIFLTIFFRAETIMALFGENFVSGKWVLITLTVGQMVNVACGSVGYLLIAGGQETHFRNITSLSVLAHLLMVVGFVKIIGLIGAALASTISLIGLNVFATIGVYRRLGVVTIFGMRGRRE